MKELDENDILADKRWNMVKSINGLTQLVVPENVENFLDENSQFIGRFFDWGCCYSVALLDEEGEFKKGFKIYLQEDFDKLFNWLEKTKEELKGE